MVELEPVAAAEDKALLKGLVESHAKYTGSKQAKRLLEAWDTALPKFVKIMPIDYKRVVAERKAAAAAAKAGGKSKK
jgi:glutamate synthase (NADPH/NADH) large chain/glutamate synthase (ferredoxin)